MFLLGLLNLSNLAFIRVLTQTSGSQKRIGITRKTDKNIFDYVTFTR